jgi:chaperone required for assembly of F1-ATPase
LSKLRRFYKTASASPAEGGGHGVALDGKPLRTPAKAVLVVPTRTLAEAIASEWEAQGEVIEPAGLRLTRLANTAIDRARVAREAVIEEILAFGGSDLVCYRAEGPIELVRRQNAAWEPLLAWLQATFGVALRVTAGVVPLSQSEAALASLRAVLAAMDDMVLTALQSATTACGSLVIALALAEGRITATDAFRLSRIDEAFQAERWGEVDEARATQDSIREVIASAGRFMELCRA